MVLTHPSLYSSLKGHEDPRSEQTGIKGREAPGTATPLDAHLTQVGVSEGPPGLRVGDDDLHSWEDLREETGDSASLLTARPMRDQGRHQPGYLLFNTPRDVCRLEQPWQVPCPYHTLTKKALSAG